MVVIQDRDSQQMLLVPVIDSVLLYRDGASHCCIVANYNFFENLKKIFEDVVAMVKEKLGKKVGLYCV